MNAASPVLAIEGAGMVTAVGHGLEASCAAMRCRINQFRETAFVDRRGEPITGAGIAALDPEYGVARQARMLASALREAAGADAFGTLPLLLCLAAPTRPGRAPGFPQALWQALRRETGEAFHRDSACIEQGGGGLAEALALAKRLLYGSGHRAVLVAAVDSLLDTATLTDYERQNRLLSSNGTDGFIPGEAAAALRLAKPSGQGGELRVSGVGVAREPSRPGGDMPSHGAGLAEAIKLALADAGLQKSEIGLSIADIAGESYYFRDTALAWARAHPKQGKPAVCWLPAESLGHVGAAAGVVGLAWLKVAQERGYTPGPRGLCHVADDEGDRVAVVCEFTINGRRAEDGA